MPRETIEIIGAKQNNLRNVSLEIPRDRLTVITGVSGSGKSSLAFDVIYGEAQRRFLESVSNFARSRINQVKKPNVEFVRGLSPVIAIEQKKGNANPRSTVGTVTDIQDYLRLLFATVGVGECPICGHPLKPVNASRMAEHIASLPQGAVVELRAPTAKIYGEDYNYLFESIRKKGYKHLLIDGEPFDLSEKWELDEDRDYDMEIVLERFTVHPNAYIQIAKTIEAAIVSLDEDIFIRTEIIESPAPVPGQFHGRYACPEHHYTLCELQPFHFSFNLPASACNTCLGIGKSYVVEPRFLVANPERSLMKGALRSTVFNPSGKDSYRASILYSLSVKYNFSLDTPYNMLPAEVHRILMYGTDGEPVEMLQPPFSKKRCWIVGRVWPFRGYVQEVTGWYRRYIHHTTGNESIEPDFIREVMVENICPECGGARLKKHRLSIRVAGKNIHDLSMMQIAALRDFIAALDFTGARAEVAMSIVNELVKRLSLLIDVGLHYLNLGRRSDSISGGEMQRIKMSTQISSELMGMLYIMDEPSIGLHPRDSEKVIGIMKQLRDIGNTVIVVEHDLDTMRSADFLVEIGPGPGIHGGNIITTGTCEKLIGEENSVTGAYLAGRRFITTPARRRTPSDRFITIQGARENNLKNITVDIPLGIFVCVTGVSGSGKSTLIYETMFKQLEILKKGARIVAGAHDFVLGYDEINNIINIDQSAIGRSSKSNPATYVGIYDRIRDLFAATPDAVAKGYRALDFSLTHANGTRCEHCTGDGVIVTSLQFMADVETVCPVCKGERFSQEGLEIMLNGKNIGDVLNMTVEEALAFFSDNKYLSHKLGIMNELGLGYITLGQSSTTLSGGEAQRVKLAHELAKIKRGTHNFYILDEPTTGLHLSDIEKLLLCIDRLVAGGHTVLVIEHNLDVIKSADYIIDMGPEGGRDGGYVVAEGTPEDVVKVEASYTGRYLKTAL